MGQRRKITLSSFAPLITLYRVLEGYEVWGVGGLTMYSPSNIWGGLGEALICPLVVILDFPDLYNSWRFEVYWLCRIPLNQSNPVFSLALLRTDQQTNQPHKYRDAHNFFSNQWLEFWKSGVRLLMSCTYGSFLAFVTSAMLRTIYFKRPFLGGSTHLTNNQL